MDHNVKPHVEISDRLINLKKKYGSSFNMFDRLNDDEIKAEEYDELYSFVNKHIKISNLLENHGTYCATVAAGKTIGVCPYANVYYYPLTPSFDGKYINIVKNDFDEMVST